MTLHIIGARGYVEYGFISFELTLYICVGVVTPGANPWFRRDPCDRIPLHAGLCVLCFITNGF